MDRIQLSGCAIIDDGKLLVLWKKKHGHYEFPGGKVEVGESLEEAAIRETKEEIGCDVQLIKKLGYKEFRIEGKDFQSHKFQAVITDGIPTIMEPEAFRDIFWLPMREHKKYSVASNVREFCEDYIHGLLSMEPTGAFLKRADA